MAILKAYMDDSGEDTPQHRYASLFGFAGEWSEWQRFEGLWKAALGREGIAHLHLREDSHRTKCLLECADVIKTCGLVGFGSIVRLDGLRRFQAEHGIEVDDYALNLYTSQIVLAGEFPDDAIEIELDRAPQKKMERLIALASEWIETDPLWTDRCNRINVGVLPKDGSFRNIRPIQAADFLAWEARKDLDQKHGWFDTTDKRGTVDAHHDMIRWLWQETGKFVPSGYIRPSMNGLLDAEFIPTVVWEYESLKRLHEIRNGSWPKL